MIEKNRVNDFIEKEINYTVLSTSVIQSVKDPCALAVWAYLCSKPKDWVVRMKEVQNHFSMSKEKIAKCFNCLIDFGLVYRDHPKDEAGRFGGYDYSVCNSGTMSFRGGIEIPDGESPAPGKPAPGKPESGKPASGKPDTYIYKEYTNNKNIQITRDTKKENIKRKKVSDTNDRFSTFYEQYPKKVGKVYAEKVFGRLSKKDQEALLESMETVIKFYAESEKQFIPNPSTFINQRRWEDDMSYSQNPANDIGF